MADSNIKQIDIGYGFTVKTYEHSERHNDYFIVEFYKDGKLQFFDEKIISCRVNITVKEQA